MVTHREVSMWVEQISAIGYEPSWRPAHRYHVSRLRPCPGRKHPNCDSAIDRRQNDSQRNKRKECRHSLARSAALLGLTCSKRELCCDTGGQVTAERRNCGKVRSPRRRSIMLFGTIRLCSGRKTIRGQWRLHTMCRSEDLRIISNEADYTVLWRHSSHIVWSSPIPP